MLWNRCSLKEKGSRRCPLKSDSHGRGKNIVLPTTQAEYYGKLLVGETFLALQESAAFSKHFRMLRGKKAGEGGSQALGSCWLWLPALHGLTECPWANYLIFVFSFSSIKPGENTYFLWVLRWLCVSIMESTSNGARYCWPLDKDCLYAERTPPLISVGDPPNLKLWKGKNGDRGFTDGLENTLLSVLTLQKSGRKVTKLQNQSVKPSFDIPAATLCQSMWQAADGCSHLPESLVGILANFVNLLLVRVSLGAPESFVESSSPAPSWPFHAFKLYPWSHLAWAIKVEGNSSLSFWRNFYQWGSSYLIDSSICFVIQVVCISHVRLLMSHCDI